MFIVGSTFLLNVVIYPSSLMFQLLLSMSVGLGTPIVTNLSLRGIIASNF